MGGTQMLTNPSYWPGQDDDADDVDRQIAGFASPAPAQALVMPPPNTAPQTSAGQTTPQSGSIKTPPSQAEPKRAGLAGAFQQRTADYNASGGPAAYAASQLAPAADPANPDPGGFARPGGTTPVMPAIPQGGVQPVQGPSTLDREQAELARLTSTGSGISQIKSPVKRVLARIGDDTLAAILPGIEPLVGGTEGHHQLLVGREQQLIGNEQAQQAASANLAETQQKTALDAAKAQGMEPEIVTPEMHAQNPDLIVGATYRPADLGGITRAATTGHLRIQGIQQKDIDEAPSKGMKVVTDPATGEKSIVEDPDSVVTQSRVALNQYRDSMAKIAKWKTEIEQEKITPGTPAWNQRQQQIAVEGERAQAYYGRYLLAAKGTDLQGHGLPGRTELTDDQGNTTGVGTAFQSQASKNQAQVAQFNDVSGSLDTLEQAARAMSAKGQRIDNTLVAAALAQPEGTATQWVQGQLAKSNLSPEQRNYVIGLVSARENLQAMRKAGGLPGATESQVNRLLDMLPNASTPDLDYFLRQTNQIHATTRRLAEGIPGVQGGHQVHTTGGGRHQPNGWPENIKIPAGQVGVQLKDGRYGHIDPKQKERFLKDNPGAKVF